MPYAQTDIPPLALKRAIEADEHWKAEGAQLSVTKLIAPPLIRWLKMKYGKEIVYTYADDFWMYYGKIKHYLLEQYAGQKWEKDEFAECKVSTVVNDIKISGIIDLVKGNTISDYKDTSAWSVARALKEGIKPDWIAQPNCYRLMFENMNPVGWPIITKLSIIATMRDHGPRHIEDGILTPWHEFPVPLWTTEQTRAYMQERVELHRLYLDAEKSACPPCCTEEEMWYKPAKWAVHKKNKDGSKQINAKRLLPSEKEAVDWGNEQALLNPKDWQNGFCLETRSPVYGRCQKAGSENGYCGVATVCPYRKERKSP